MRRIGIGFAGVLFFSIVMIFANGFAFAYEGITSGDQESLVSSDQETLVRDIQVTGSLYSGGFMNEVLTRSNPSPWNAVRYYVGNHPKLIVKILKEQGFNLDRAMKYPVGMTVRIPQKYVLKELLPTPSQAEVAIKDAEHQAEMQKQANKFFAALKSKDSFLATSYGFIVFLAIALFAAVVSVRSRHNKFFGAEAAANVFEKKLDTALTEKRALAQEKKVLSELWQGADSEKIRYASQIVKMGEMLGEKDKIITELLAQTEQYRVIDNSGKEHPCGIIFGCPYCLPDDYVQLKDKKSMLRHISKCHPEQTNPDPKSKQKLETANPNF